MYTTEEDVKDFRPFCTGLATSEIVVLFLCPEGDFHRSQSPNSLLCIFRQCINRVQSLNTLNDSFPMNDIPSTNMLLTFAPSSMLFTSLPRTFGPKCGLLRLIILFGMLSLLSLFRKWFFFWRYIFAMISRSLFSLTVNKFSAISRSRSNFLSCSIRSFQTSARRGHKN